MNKRKVRAGITLGVFTLLCLMGFWQVQISHLSTATKLVPVAQSSPAPWPTPTSQVDQSVNARDVFTFVCETSNNFKPESFFFACADGNDGITKVTWSAWSVKGATGTGKRFTNDCNPSCVDGTVHYTPVEIYLDTPVQMGKYAFLTLLHYRAASSQTWSTWDLSEDYRMMK